jgi:ankyrin repeat protein
MSRPIEEAVIKLYEAIELGDTNIVDNMLDGLSSLTGDLGEFIKSDYYLTNDFGFGTTFLEFAVEKQNNEIVSLLIDSGMDVNTLGGSSSPLMEATIINNTEIAKLLINNVPQRKGFKILSNIFVISFQRKMQKLLF